MSFSSDPALPDRTPPNRALPDHAVPDRTPADPTLTTPGDTIPGNAVPGNAVPGGAVPEPTAATDLRRAIVGVGGMFLLNGLLFGAWAASLPGLRDRFDTNARGVAVLMITCGIVAIGTMQIGGRWADRSGARLPTLVSAPVMVAALLVVAWAPVYPAAVLGAAVFGAGNGCMDVSMNALAVHAERRRGRPVMSRFHAFFSIGAAAGAGLAGLASRIVDAEASRVAVVLVTVSALGLAGLVALRPVVPQSAPAHRATDKARGPLPRATWLLGSMALCFGLTEGTGADWSSLHVAEVANVDSGTGAFGLACMSAFMVVTRLVGDHAVERFGRNLVVGASGGVAALGYVITVVGSGLPLLLFGWSLVGFGVGMIAPQIYGLAGHLGGGRVMAVVVGFGYAAFLSGPAIIGPLADRVGLATAMLVPLTTAVALVVMSYWMPRIAYAPTDTVVPALLEE